ncbi:aldehyde dehydrogenase family protein [Paraburkholderia pallida]|uniref:Aldehyde dehydrogenase family protein n=1 Tax=Paraburkholderia pallida TaxID=2547399 RepID=A0A4P7DA44_9BURK|nr:aldehyde dehydrogenase family protein [Paraburkholderia pallida]QBR04120.1 aldehyde dehydrogenase family protein [Paraburkholderia pallida]
MSEYSGVKNVDGIREYRYFAGGEWRSAKDNKLFDVYQPYDRALYARVAAGGQAEAAIAVDAAAAAFPAWAETTPAERARLFFRAAEIVKRRRAEIAEILAVETGSTISFATFQQDLVAATIEQAAGWMYLPKGEVLASNAHGTHSIGVRRPLGVVASFTPWNGANVLSWRAVLSPIAAGNTVVVKPSELAPISAGLILAQIVEEAGFPKGVVNVVTHAPGEAGAIADVFFESQHVRVINLIGGVKTAKMLARRAGETLKRTTMELGGFNPLIVLDDVDLDYAVRTATFGSFFHQGQICLNTRRIIVQRKIANDFLEKFTARTKTLPSGDPRDHATIIGPLITPAAVKLVDDRVKEALAKGARLHTGGVFENQIYQPTILSNVPSDAAIANEETFGPVVIVEVVDTPEQAVEAANRTLYGLSSSILAGDTWRAFELAPKIQAGIVNVNSPTVNDEIHAPMGGVRDSGWGRTGPESLKEFQDVIWISAHSGQRQYPF